MEKQNFYDHLIYLDPFPKQLKKDTKREELIRYMSSKIITTHYKDRAFLLSMGKISEHIYFVESGIVRGYEFDERGKEKTLFLWDDYAIMTDIHGYMNQTPSNIYVEVMANSSISSISYKHLERIFKKFPYTRPFVKRLVEYHLRYSNKSFYNFANPPAIEKYRDLIRRYPNIEMKISKETIASFLEITPQHLSRIIKSVQED